jgi:hypothetical protein
MGVLLMTDYRFARIEKGVAFEFLTSTENLLPHLPEGLGWIDVTGIADVVENSVATEVDGVWTFSAPVPYVAPRQTQLSSLELKARFTDSEWNGFVNAAMSDKDVFSWLWEAGSADYIDIDSPRVSAGLDFIISKNLLDPVRKQFVLA